MKRLYLFLLLAAVTLSGMAQTIGEAFYIYRNDGQFNAFFRDEVISIEYSYEDTDGNTYDEIVTQIVNTADSVYKIPLATIDSVSFVQPETEYKPDVIRMDENWLSYVVSVSDDAIIFKETTPTTLLPIVGQVIVAETFESPFDTGFSGRVTQLTTNADGIVCLVDPVSLSDIYEHIVSVGISASEGEESPLHISRRIWGMDTDTGVRFPLPNIDLALGPVTLSCVPNVVLKYIVCVGEPNMKNYVDIRVQHNYQGAVKLDCNLEKEYKPEPNWNKNFIPIKTSIPGLYGKIMFGTYVRASGAVKLSATQPFTIEGVVGFVYSDDKGLTGVNNWSSSMLDTEISLSIDGSISAGVAVRLQFGIFHERLASADVTAYLGPKISGNLALSSSGIIDKSLYSAIKDSEITLSLGAEIVPGYRWVVDKWIGELNYPEDHHELPVSLDLGYNLNHWYAVPTFDNLSWTSDEWIQVVH